MRVVLRNATIVSNDGQRKRVDILTESKRIVSISENPLDIPAIEYDMTGYTVLPGFINTHVHLIDCFDGFNETKLKRWLMSGITYLRDQGILSRHSIDDAAVWKEKIGKFCMYPHIAVCGKFISAVNGYGGIEPLGVTNEAEARTAVDMQIDRGADHIKIALDKGYDEYTQSLDLLPLNILSAICDQAHRRGKMVSAHVNQSSMLEILLKAGIDEAAHACYDRIPDETLKYMVHHGVYMTPTLSVYGEIMANFGAPYLYTAMDNTKRFADIGGIIGLGNDYIEEKAVWSPVGMPIMEIELLLKAGLSVSQVIDAATMGGAEILGLEDFGKIKENYHADIIAVKGDPYEIPYLLSNVGFVMKDGIVVKGGQ